MQTTNELTIVSAALMFCKRTVADLTFKFLVSFYLFAQLVGLDCFKSSLTLGMGSIDRSSKEGHNVLLSVNPPLGEFLKQK